jgi:hypothetical protein
MAIMSKLNWYPVASGHYWRARFSSISRRHFLLLSPSMVHRWQWTPLYLFFCLFETVASYDLVREYSGSTFFDGWDFFGSWDNLTLGLRFQLKSLNLFWFLLARGYLVGQWKWCLHARLGLCQWCRQRYTQSRQHDGCLAKLQEKCCEFSEISMSLVVIRSFERWGSQLLISMTLVLCG